MKKVIVVIIVIFINLLTLQGNVFSKSFYQIPLEPDYWFKKFCGTLEETGNGIKMYGSAYRWGNFMFSKKLYNFSDSEVYVKWLANGDNSYGWFSVSLFGLIGAGFTTDHSWDGSKVILHNEWYYTRIKINSDYTYECVTSTGNYDVNGGNIIDNKSGTLEPNRHEMVYRNQISVSFGDVYAGNSSYMEVEEVKTNAKIIPIENKAKTIYDFENSTNVPSTFTFSGNWIIDNKGFDSSKSLFIETSNTSSITMSVNNAIAISFKFKETNDSIAHGSYKFHFLINGKSMSHAINGDNGSCWNERFYPLYSDRNILEWKVTHPNSVWIDNITIYKSFTDDTPPDNDGNQTDQIISSIPQLINYQGMLTNAEGKPIETDEYKLSFSIFNHPTGGTEVWGPQKFDGSEGNGNKVPVVRGLFNVLLGPKDIHGRLIKEAFQTQKSVYLEITIEDQNPIKPRQQILSVPYSLMAEKAITVENGAITNDKIADHSISIKKLNFSDDNGNVKNLNVSKDLIIGEEQTNKTLITGNKVGIGTSNPSKNLEINGTLGFKGGKGPFCIFSAQCPDGWTKRGIAGFIANDCPFSKGSHSHESWDWCHPAICCNE